MFVDNASVIVKAGDGGNGIISFSSERGTPRGGPDGGDGGNGGDILFRADYNQNTLANFRFQKELKAEDGKNGAKTNCHGRRGKVLEIAVPVGTQITINGELVADFTTENQSEIIARGGKGGYGNSHFTSSTRQAPKIAEKGEKGEEFELSLELKIIADVGLVGLPNAGKSTLLARSSSAKPKIANYPFTTLNPHLGVVQIEKGKELLMADIPGLIDGASEGKGLGDEFLRHVERTQVILHMLDVYSDDIVRDYKTIQKELKNYKVDLTRKPQIVAVTKIEGLDADIVEDQIKTLKKATKKTPIFAISSLSGDGLQKLLYALYAEVKAHKDVRDAAVEEAGRIPVITMKENNEDKWQVEVKKRYVVITGRKIERFARRTDFASEDGVRRLRDIMRKMGIAKNLEKKSLAMNTKIYFGDDREDYMEY
jgi:GTP-binding protein